MLKLKIPAILVAFFIIGNMALGSGESEFDLESLYTASLEQKKEFAQALIMADIENHNKFKSLRDSLAALNKQSPELNLSKMPSMMEVILGELRSPLKEEIASLVAGCVKKLKLDLAKDFFLSSIGAVPLSFVDDNLSENDHNTIKILTDAGLSEINIIHVLNLKDEGGKEGNTSTTVPVVQEDVTTSLGNLSLNSSSIVPSFGTKNNSHVETVESQTIFTPSEDVRKQRAVEFGKVDCTDFDAPIEKITDPDLKTRLNEIVKKLEVLDTSNSTTPLRAELEGIVRNYKFMTDIGTRLADLETKLLEVSFK